MYITAIPQKKQDAGGNEIADGHRLRKRGWRYFHLTQNERAEHCKAKQCRL
jgi:hypothetical protein